MTPHCLFRPALLALLMVLAGGPLLAQDTRGSMVPDTLVVLSDGTTAKAQDLQPGDLLWTLGSDGKPVPGKITSVRRQHADSYISLKAGKAEFQATGSHRIALAGGKLVWINTINVGDKVWIWGPSGIEEQVVTMIREYPANLICYDLTVDGHRPFRASGLIVGDELRRGAGPVVSRTSRRGWESRTSGSSLGALILSSRRRASRLPDSLPP